MGHDFIGVTHVDVCEQLPNNAQPYAECMYRAGDDTYYECVKNNQRTYYRAANNSTTTHWSINNGTATDLVDTLRNRGIDISEVFTVAAHTGNTLAPILAILERVDDNDMEHQLGTVLWRLVNFLRSLCNNDNGNTILLSV